MLGDGLFQVARRNDLLTFRKFSDANAPIVLERYYIRHGGPASIASPRCMRGINNAANKSPDYDDHDHKFNKRKSAMCILF